MPREPKRSHQPISRRGPGLVFTSPIKKRSAKAKVPFTGYTHAANQQRLEEKLQFLLDSEGGDPNIGEPQQPDEWVDIVESVESEMPPGNDLGGIEIDESTSQLSPLHRRIVPNNAANRLYTRWAGVLPGLVNALIMFLSTSIGRRQVFPDKSILARCNSKGTCSTKTYQVLGLYFEHFETHEVTACACQDLLQVLISHGLFPTSPTRPSMAVSIHLIQFYQALFERSCDAVTAMASALNSLYKRRGFTLLNKKGEPIQNPFRRSLGYAIQWFDSLDIRLQKRLDMAVHHAKSVIQSHGNCVADGAPPKSPSLPLVPDFLQQRCPACFSGTSFGKPLSQGGDIHVCTDGNFNHRHLRKAGDCPNFYEPQYILSKAQVDRVGDHINNARKSRPKPRIPKLPDSAVDECENGMVAGIGSNVKTNMDLFDDGGLMCLVCRHDIPLFFANIDSPGEQQKYAIALIEHLLSFLPKTATLSVLYDVGCVLDRSLELYDFLPSEVTSRIVFGTSAMHAYGHQWACQLMYNPRLRPGFGLTDGEGVERLWSRMRKLIGVTRSSARSRRIWLIDRQANSIGVDLRDDLGQWIKRRLTKSVEVKALQAKATLHNCGVPMPELRQLWKEQQDAQLSLRAHAPARLKKELDSVLLLQGEIEVIDEKILQVQQAIGSSSPSDQSLSLLTSLQTHQSQLKNTAEELYASLNVQDSFPELTGINLEFVRTLLLARDLKINIRKRAIGSFFEWDRLDQAVGGRDQAIGTKLHQYTRKAISKRVPALLTSIRKFNRYCTILSDLHEPDWDIPIPNPLPTKMADLRNSPVLMEDVWITRSVDGIPRWLEDLTVREGIRAMLKADRCLEERRRLGDEADNLCRWYGWELGAVELATALPENAPLAILLQQRHSHLRGLKSAWTNPITSSVQYDSHVHRARETTQRIMRATITSDLHWITPLLLDTHIYQVIEDGDGNTEAEWQLSNIEDGVNNTLDSEPDSDTNDTVLEASEAIFGDILTDDPHTGADTADDGQDIILVAPAAVPLIWEVPAICHVDNGVAQALTFQSHTAIPLHHQRRILRDGKRRIQFDNDDLKILQSPTACLTGDCLNSCAALLQHFLASPYCPSQQSANQCAIFSTYDLLMVRHGVQDGDFWRRTSLTGYWDKPLWLLPIHRSDPGHWVLTIISPHTRELFLYDSFAERDPWIADIKDIVKFIERLIILSNRNNHSLMIDMIDWVARPVVTVASQTNGYDCGIWVLAGITAVLRGYHTMGLLQSDVRAFREVIYKNALWLPTVPIST